LYYEIAVKKSLAVNFSNVRSFVHSYDTSVQRHSVEKELLISVLNIDYLNGVVEGEGTPRRLHMAPDYALRSTGEDPRNRKLRFL
jgi:hypothetical protein